MWTTHIGKYSKKIRVGCRTNFSVIQLYAFTADTDDYSLVSFAVFMPNTPWNHAITYTNTKVSRYPHTQISAKIAKDQQAECTMLASKRITWNRHDDSVNRVDMMNNGLAGINREKYLIPLILIQLAHKWVLLSCSRFSNTDYHKFSFPRTIRKGNTLLSALVRASTTSLFSVKLGQIF